MAFHGRDNCEDLNYISETRKGETKRSNSSSTVSSDTPVESLADRRSASTLKTPTVAQMSPPENHSIDHIVSIFDDVEKMFQRYPQFDVTSLSAGSDLMISEAATSREGERVIPVKDSNIFTEDDFSSHRRDSFPHIHHPLRPLRSKSHKNIRHLEHKKKKKKKKRKMHVTKSFPSKMAVQSPPIPEGEEEEYTTSDSESDYSDSRRGSTISQDMVDSASNMPILMIKEPAGDRQEEDLELALKDIPAEPPTPDPSVPQIHTPQSEKSIDSNAKTANFFIGEHESSPPRDLSAPSIGRSMDSSFGQSQDEVSSIMSDLKEERPQFASFHLSDITDQEPLLSRQAEMPSSGSFDDTSRKSRVQFCVGGDSSANLLEDQDNDSTMSLHRQENGSIASSTHSRSDGSLRSHRHKHKHHHHDHYKREDLMLRRQKGSEVHLEDADKKEIHGPTEDEEANTLHTVDLDEMASHRLDNLRGMRHHKRSRNKSAMTSIVHIGKHDKGKKKIFKPKKKFDHQPHEVFVELDELYEGEGDQYEWREKARWIKFEEDVEEGAERWGKPHVASLSFHSLLELRRGLENGTMILDLEAEDLPAIVNYVVDDMIIHDNIKSEHKGKVLRTLLMKHKHQKEKSSLKKSFTSSSFRSLSSDKLEQTESLLQKEKQQSNNKKDKVENLEFVKVDVDNNMKSDGVHIGITTNESRQKNIQDIMRRIPQNAEALTVLVGCVDYLNKPTMAFVRLAEGQVLDNLTEVPLPVRFLFVLLGPENAGMDYHEVGRSISTLMANQHFHDIAYRALSRDELLHGINEFLDESIVLPPGDWDQKTLLPIMDMARKKARVKRRQKRKEDELQALLQKEEKDKIPLDPIKRTGRLFGGLINDIKRRYPYYASDFKDALNFQCLAAFIFIFFACFAPTIAFGGLLSEKTKEYMGVTETALSTSVSGILFGLFSAQPLMILGATGPVLVFEQSLYQFCNSYEIEFLPMRFWIGFWVMIITFVVIGLEGSFLVKHITRFTEEIFTIVISLIFIYEVISKIKEIFKEHPLLSSYCLVNDSSSYNSSENSTLFSTAPVITTGATYTIINGSRSPLSNLYRSDAEDFHLHHYVDPQPNTALLSIVLMLGTFFIAYFLRIFRNSRFLGRNARRALGDFGVVIALFVMVLIDYSMPQVYTQKLIISDTFEPTNKTKRGWFVNPMGKPDKPMKTDMIIGACLPAFLLFILLFLETQITEMTLNKKEYKMKKGSGYHLDQVLLGILTFIGGLFGLPWMCAATVRTLCHVSALSVMSRTHAPGEKPKLVKIREQRVTNIAVNILIGASMLWGPVLRLVPLAVLFGIFLYVGVSALSSLQLYRRLKLLLIPVKHHPSIGFVRRVRTMKMHLFTVIQLGLLVLMFLLKLSPLAIAFPLFIILLIPLRLKLMVYIFNQQELNELDKEDEDSEFEDDDDPDFYQLAHMPI